MSPPHKPVYKLPLLSLEDEQHEAKMSDTNRLMGDSHPLARLSDAEVDWIRDIYEEGFVGYRTLALAFGVSRATIQSICNYYRRSATVERTKTILTPKPQFFTGVVTRFSSVEVEIIRTLFGAGWRCTRIGRLLNISPDIVWQLVHGIKRPYD